MICLLLIDKNPILINPVILNPYADGGKFGQYKMIQKKMKKMTETLAYGYSSEGTQRELSKEYQHDRVKMLFKKPLRPCPLVESSLTIGRVK